MNHSFNVEVAKKYGIEEAILIENIAFWIGQNIDKNRNYKKGNYWVYNSYKSFSEVFPYMNYKKIQRALIKLENLGVLKSGNFNKLSYDRTKWYTIIDGKVKEIYKLNRKYSPLAEKSKKVYKLNKKHSSKGFDLLEFESVFK